MEHYEVFLVSQFAKEIEVEFAKTARLPVIPCSDLAQKAGSVETARAQMETCESASQVKKSAIRFAYIMGLVSFIYPNADAN